MVADNTISPFDAAITKDMRTAMQNRLLLAGIICKLHVNKNKPVDAQDMEVMTDEEVALMVVCTELVAATIARQMHRLKQEGKPE